MYSTYLKLKTNLNSGVDGIIHQAEGVMDHSSNIKSPALSNSVKWTAKSVCEYGQLFLDFPRLDAYKVTGSRGTVICAGMDDSEIKIIVKVLFPEGGEKTELGRIPLWQLSAKTKEWLDEVDVVVFRVSRKFHYHLEAPYIFFENPSTIMQILPLSRSLEEILAGKEMADLRRNINKVQRANYTDRFSHSMADFDYFYHHMYVPTVKKRFGDRALLDSYELLESHMNRGGLLLICLDNQLVAGSLMYLRQTTCFGCFSGMLDGDPGLLKKGVGAAIYWRSIKWAIEQGAKEFNFMVSVAWQDDGIFQAKNKWKPKIVDHPWQHNKLVFAANHLSAEWRDHLNQIGFFTEVKGQYLRVYINELNQPCTPEDIEAKKEQALKNGLSGIQLVSPGYKQNYFI